MHDGPLPVAPESMFPDAFIVADLRDRDYADFLEARRDGIGSSDLGTIMGNSQYGTRIELWQDKTRRVPVDSNDTEEQNWGRLLEEPIAREFARRECGQLMSVPYILASKAEPWKRASIDFVMVSAFGPEIVECKNLRFGFDTLPAWRRAQVQWQMDVTGLERGHVVVLLSGMKLDDPFTVEPHPEFSASINAQAEEFWAYVQLDEEPPPMAADIRRTPHDPDSEVKLDADMKLLLIQRVRTQQLARDSKKVIADLDEELLPAIGVAEHIYDEHGTKLATYKAAKNGTRTLRPTDDAKHLATLNQ
jgi:putative phage-type endonuclease